jgi:hypothetical protein
MWVTKFLIFQGAVLDLILLTALPLFGITEILDTVSYSNATVVIGAGRSAESFTVPKAKLLALYFNTAVGVVRLLAGLNPTEPAIWKAAILTEIIECILTAHCALASSPNPAILAGDKPLMDELMPGCVITAVTAVWMMSTYPKVKHA